MTNIEPHMIEAASRALAKLEGKDPDANAARSASAPHTPAWTNFRSEAERLAVMLHAFANPGEHLPAPPADEPAPLAPPADEPPLAPPAEGDAA